MIVLITGSNKGIGFQIARLFAQKHQPEKARVSISGSSSKYTDSLLTVIITSRNHQNGTAALEKLQTEFAHKKSLRFDFVNLDLVDESSRQKAIETVRSKYSKINVLINNAGFAFKSDSTATNEEQAKTTFEIK